MRTSARRANRGIEFVRLESDAPKIGAVFFVRYAVGLGGAQAARGATARQNIRPGGVIFASRNAPRRLKKFDRRGLRWRGLGASESNRTLLAL